MLENDIFKKRRMPLRLLRGPQLPVVLGCPAASQMKPTLICKEASFVGNKRLL